MNGCKGMIAGRMFGKKKKGKSKFDPSDESVKANLAKKPA
jgi:hypothetical protein